MIGKVTSYRFFTGYIVTYFILVCLSFAFLLQVPETEFSFLSICFSYVFVFDLFVTELLVLLAVASILLHRSFFSRVALHLIFLLFIVIYGIQLASFYLGREFVSRLAVENINHIGLLSNYKNTLFICTLLIIWATGVICTEKLVPKSNSKKQFLAVPLFLYPAGCLCLIFSHFWLPVSVLQSRGELLDYNYLQRTSPVLSLWNSIHITGSSNSLTFNEAEIKELNRQGFFFNDTLKYPLVKETYHDGRPPFPLLNKHTGGGQPNIIVFFSEGISARSIKAYGSKYNDLTPNIDDFAKHSMVVNNYYSHTAATYRGLIGQLCSIFPAIGGEGGWESTYKNQKGGNYLSLAGIFNSISYDTIFIDAHEKNNAYVDNLMIKIGFKRVHTGLPLSRNYLDGVDLNLPYALSDRQLMLSLIAILQERSAVNQDGNPFFLCLYNLGTHAFTKISPDGRRYGSGKNMSLNRIHNFDNAFGMFWSYFKSSKYAENTIVIFTSDHCAYPEKSFISAFKGEDYQNLFIDKIPLVIYDSSRSIPQTYNARYSTSISFVPSLLHYLNIRNQKNPFIGTSIFKTGIASKSKFGVASFGDDVYIVDHGTVLKKGFTPKYKKRIEIIERFIKYSQQLELSQRLWDADVFNDQPQNNLSN